MKRLLTFTAFLFSVNVLTAQSVVDESTALLKRIVPAHAAQFIIEQSAGIDGDGFEIGSSKGKILLKGNNGVSIASALYYYLNEYCHAQITWNGVNLKLPKLLPRPTGQVVRKSPYKYRYDFNYCTFNYSMAWWDWNRWEQEIDWMALHGINMPLAITGEEYTWYLVYKELGFSDEDLKGFFCGPSYFSWFWMGNIDAWGGPLPMTWMKSHFELQKKIVNRQRGLGMKPVLPAFTGHVPLAFKKKFPHANLKSSNWTNGFADTYILDANDSLFAIIGEKFLRKQTELLGTDHLYSADTFNENEPASDAPEFLSQLSAKVYEGMHNADPEAVWVMQGWLFFTDRKFWKDPQTEALLKAVPNDKMIILDLATEIEPVWKRTNAFYGKPWIWNMLNNFGGNTNLFGRMETVAAEPANAWNSPNKGNMAGIGLTMEAIETNPVIYELMMHHSWNDQPIDLKKWLPKYVRNRYGVESKDAQKAWQILKETIYTVPKDKYIRDGAESILQGRPTLDSLTRWTKTKLNYNESDLWPAWDALIKASTVCKSSDGFRYDLVDLTRQVLANHALTLQQKFAVAYKKGDRFSFNEYSRRFLELIDDMDKLLGTRKEFLLGSWVKNARAWGLNESEKALYEFNAKDLITLWGDKNCPLNEYACRQWNGLLKDFYKPRWEQYIAQLNTNLSTGAGLDQAVFVAKIKDWEWNWVNTRRDYATEVSGDAVLVSKMLYNKYRAGLGK